MKLTRQFGDALVCVRYRHDGAGKLRYTTVELVVEQTPIQPRASERMLVSISHPIGDRTQRARAMALGAKWDQQEHVWKMSLRVARMLDVLDRIVAI